MSTTATVDDLVVSVAPVVKQDPELAEAITLATNELRELLQQHGIDPARRELMWGASTENPIPFVNAHLSESDEYGTRETNGTFSRRWLLDPVNRKMGVIRMLLDIRGQRRAKIGDLWRRGIDELERQEVADGQPV